jgi:hypothetical protein
MVEFASDGLLRSMCFDLFKLVLGLELVMGIPLVKLGILLLEFPFRHILIFFCMTFKRHSLFMYQLLLLRSL